MRLLWNSKPKILNYLPHDLGPVQPLYPALKWTLFRHASAMDRNVHKQLGKRIDCREIGEKFGVGSSTACKEVNTQNGLCELREYK